MQPREHATGWALPLLYITCRDLRRVAEQVRAPLTRILPTVRHASHTVYVVLTLTSSRQADERLLANSQKAGKLEEASRLLQKCFSCCLNDR